MRTTIFLFLSGCSFLALGQTGAEYREPAAMSPEMTEFWTPQPPVVTPGETLSEKILVQPPSDAIVLFDGSDLAEWEGVAKKTGLTSETDGSHAKDLPGVEAGWIIENGTLLVNKAAGDIQTKRTFGDFQLHIEWCVPDSTYRTRPRVTVLHNGILIQNNTLILGTTPYIGLPRVIPHEKGPIRLQAHGDKSQPIRFRNIWIREL